MVQISATLVALTIFLVIVVLVVLLYFLFVRTDPLVAATTGPGCLNPPAPPTNVLISNPLADIVAVSWDAIPTASTYRIYLDKNPGFLIRDAEQVRSSELTSSSFGNLETGFTYYVKVTSFNACGESSPSNEVSTLIPYVWPERFQIINADDATLDLVRLDELVPNPERIIINENCFPPTCWWNFNEVDQTIRLTINNDKCLTRDGDQLWGRDCISSDLDQRQWIYDPAQKSICLLSNSNVCIRLEDNFFIEGFITVGPYTGNLLSKWDLLEV